MTNIDEDFVQIKDIDSGSSGKVSLCHNLLSNKEIAIKKISKALLLHDSFIVQIRNEIKIMKRINHTNCIKLFKVYEDNKDVILMIEYSPYGNLYNRMKKIEI